MLVQVTTSARHGRKLERVMHHPLYALSTLVAAANAASIAAAGAHMVAGGFGHRYINLADPDAPPPSASELYR
jgi:hypothetical protein